VHRLYRAVWRFQEPRSRRSWRVPGSGVGQDGGVGQLWLVRVDRGTANLASSIQQLIQRTTSALGGAKLSPRASPCSRSTTMAALVDGQTQGCNLNTIASVLLFRPSSTTHLRPAAQLRSFST